MAQMIPPSPFPFELRDTRSSDQVLQAFPPTASGPPRIGELVIWGDGNRARVVDVDWDMNRRVIVLLMRPG